MTIRVSVVLRRTVCDGINFSFKFSALNYCFYNFTFHSSRSEVNKFVGPKARAELSRVNSNEKYIYICTNIKTESNKVIVT